MVNKVSENASCQWATDVCIANLANANQWLLYKWPSNRLSFALVLDVILLTPPTQFNRIAFVQLFAFVQEKLMKSFHN